MPAFNHRFKLNLTGGFPMSSLVSWLAALLFVALILVLPYALKFVSGFLAFLFIVLGLFISVIKEKLRYLWLILESRKHINRNDIERCTKY